MSRPTANQRLSVAAYPPPEIRRAMVEAFDAIGELPAYRATPFDQIQLTLQFLGDVPTKSLDQVSESVERATAGIGELELTPRRLTTLPQGDVARLVACETDAPGMLLELHRRLAVRLARKTRNDAADRYRPHLTLCRFESPTHMAPLDHAVSMPSFRVDSVQLMRTVLRPGGAEHIMVHRYPF